MTYKLFIGDKSFSSWSLRGWLMLDAFQLPYETHMVSLFSGTLRQDLADLAPARTVPALRTPEGHVLTDSLAMAETLVERHPDVAMLPTDPGARALARNLIAEMHAGFSALRTACPTIFTHVLHGFAPSDNVLRDVARIEELWALAKERHGQNGPWLFGAYSLADVFYAPVAGRFATYGLPISGPSQKYVETQINSPQFVRWHLDALQETHTPSPYTFDLERGPWPIDDASKPTDPA